MKRCFIVALFALLSIFGCKTDVGDFLPEFILASGLNPPLYTISGEVTGLLGANMVISNGHESLALSPPLNAGDPVPFTFSGLRPETVYNIIIQSYPQLPTQVCNVTNGVGKIVDKHIDNIQIDCVDGYQITGTAQSLVGSGLTLQLTVNETSTVSEKYIVAPGTTSLTFVKPLLLTETYTVDIISQPLSPSQDCVFPGSVYTASGDKNSNTLPLIDCATNSFLINVDITGLSTDGLQLSLNGAAAQPIAAGTTQHTLDLLPSGSTYDIAIVSQPTGGVVCQLFGGSDVVGNSNVNASLFCGNGEPVGGNVTNLSGTGLQLTMSGTGNGGVPQVLDVAGGSTSFVFPVPLYDGETYSITLTNSQTVTPWQNCVLTGGTVSGTATLGTPITPLEVICTTNSYPLTVTVAGNSAPITVSHDGGTTTATMADGATLTLATLLSGEVYNFVVSNIPATQDCSPLSSTGTVTNSAINISVSCWDKPGLSITVSGLEDGETIDFTEQVSGLNLSLIGDPDPGTNESGIINLPATTGYQLAIASAAAVGRVCAVVEQQFGTTQATGLTPINVRCVNGYLNGGRYQAVAPAQLDYRLYQGKSTATAATGITNLNRLAVSENGIYFLRNSSTNGSAIYHLSAPATAVAGEYDVGGYADGVGTAALFSGLVFDLISDGPNLYVSDTDNNAIRKMDVATNSVTTLFQDVTYKPATMAIDVNTRTLFFVDVNTSNIFKFDLVTGVVNTTPFVTGLTTPRQMVFLNGFLYVADSANNRIVRIDSGGAITASVGTTGFADGACSVAKFTNPWGMATDGYDLYVSEFDNDRIRKIRFDSAGDCSRVSTIAGSGVAADAAGTNIGINATFKQPHGMAIDGRNIYVATTGGTIYKIGDNGLVGYWPLAGNANDYASDTATALTGTWNGTEAYVTTDRYNNTTETKGAKFDNANWIDTGKSISFLNNQSFTYAAWVNVTDLNTEQMILGKVAPSNAEYNLNVATDGRVTFRYWDINWTAGVVTRSAPGIIKTGVWTHVLYAYDGNSKNGSMYVNGHLVAKSAASAIQFRNNASNLMIGKAMISSGVNANFLGGIADVRIYNRVLNEGEINELAQDASSALVGSSYNSGATGLLSHYPLTNAGTAAGLLDHGPLGYNLNLPGGPSNPIPDTGKDGDANGSSKHDGSSQYLYVSDTGGLPSGSHPRTMCSWINPSYYPASLAFIVHYGANTAGGVGSMSSLVLNAASGLAVLGKDGVDAYYPYNVPLNTWSHICASYANKNIELFVDGKSQGIKSVISDWNTTVAQLTLGIWQGWATYFPGKVDDVRIYNNVLTPDEIRQLAVQVPTGLAARYDFTDNGGADDPLKDVSGWGALLTNGGFGQTSDRFNSGSSAVTFNGFDQKLYANAPALPQGGTDRTMCVWFKSVDNPITPDQYPIIHQGDSTANGEAHYLALRNAGPNLVSSFWDNQAELTPYIQYTPGTWQHLCGTRSGLNNNLYLNGSSVATNNVGATLNIFNDALYIGVSPTGSYFKGAIDDVRVYNRVLSPAEISVLVQQPNKKIAVTTNVFDGAMTRSDSTAGIGVSGTEKADNWCIDEFGTGYKAMVLDTNGCAGAPCRRACTGANCGIGGIREHKDWLLRPNVTYLRSDGVTPIFTADWNGVFNFGSFSFTNTIGTGAATPWTGLGPTWLRDASNASNWSSAAVAGVWGDALGISSTSIYSFWGTGFNPLYCVEQ